MGKRDIRHRETKKQKKDPKKTPLPTIIVAPPAAVELIKKIKREPKEEDEE